MAVLGSADAARAEFDSEKYLVYPVGRITLRPQLEIAETYDSNLFYAETNRVEDLNTSIRPGLLAVYGERSENFFSLRYTLDGSLYLDRDDLNNFGHLIAHRSRFQLSLRAASGDRQFRPDRHSPRRNLQLHSEADWIGLAERQLAS